MKYFLALTVLLGVLVSCGFEKTTKPDSASEQINTVINEITQGDTLAESSEIDSELTASGVMGVPENVTEEIIIEEKDEPSEAQSSTQKLVEELEQVEITNSNYQNYSSTLIGNTQHTVIFFHADWCPSCSAAEEGILAGDIPENLTILKADFDTQLELREKYRVVAQHTFVSVDEKGNLISKWVGGTTVEAITERL